MRKTVEPYISKDADDLLDPDSELVEQNAEQILGYARIAEGTVALVALPLLLIFKPEHAALLYGIVGASLLYGVVGIPLVRRWGSTTIAGHLNWVVVLAQAMVAIMLTGGARSPFIFFLVIPLIGAARFGRRISLAAMGVATAGFAVVAVTTAGLSLFEVIAYLVGYCFVASCCYAVATRYVDVQRDAVLDQVTGLFNRHHLVGRVAEMDVNLSRGGRVSVVVIDLDEFKEVNDRYGHDRGDAVLRDFAYMVRANIRDQDTAFRTGGEEFAVVLPGADLFTARRVAERIRLVAEENSKMLLGVTASVGVAAAAAADHVSMNVLIKAADTALYRAKSQGRNRVCHAPEPLNGNGNSNEPQLAVAATP